MGRFEIFDMKIIYALPKYLSFVIGFNSRA